MDANGWPMGDGGTGLTGQISQTLNFTRTGKFRLALQIVSRAEGTGGIQNLGVYVDGILLQTFTPTSATSWDSDQLSLNIAATGNHTITFAAMNTTGDQSLFLDNINLVAAV